jgi:hypothetical protein
MACGRVENLHGALMSHADPRLDRGHPAPAVVFEDRDLYACVLEYSGDGSRTWKQDLLSGLVDSAVARRGGCHPDRLSLTYAWERECEEPVPGRLELLPASPRPLPGCHRPPPSRHQARRFHCRTSSRGHVRFEYPVRVDLRAPDGWGERSTSSNASERWIRSLPQSSVPPS